MKTRGILMITAAAVMMTAPAMANSPVVRVVHPVVQGEDIIVYTDRNGDISKDEFLSYQSQKFDQMASNDNRVRDESGHVLSKDDWMDLQSRRFDEIDSRHVGKISKNEFEVEAATMMEPAAGGFDESTSRPEANNQAEDTSYISGGADGAGGWTAQ
jgi:hypothetical protein